MVDRRFLEFWGSFFLAAAKGQKQMEDLTRWMSQGFKAAGFEDLTAMFTRAYGLKPLDAGNEPDGGVWETAARSFERSLMQYMSLMGMVSGEEHRRLQEKCEALEKQCADQQETIAHLRKLLGVGEAGHEEVVKKFQTMLKKQSSQFQELVLSSTRFLESAAKPAKKRN
jgi:hypothetical protein